MRCVMAMGVVATACASTGRICPTETRLASEDRPTGRVEWCAKEIGGAAAIPAPGRTRDYERVLGMAHPAALTGLVGPYTHWYPNGTVESHGSYVEDGAVSVADGAWAFWYSNGMRKLVGRYDRGRPVGCFELWDEQGNEVLGQVEGD